jgi:hypothetical protein
MAIQNFGVGHVDPLNGSNGNTGYAWSEAKQTIEAAITAGFAQINILAGLHTVSSITSPVELVLFPGTHLFINAPVACTVPINVVSYREIGSDETASPIVSTPTPVTDYFVLANGDTNLDGAMFAGIRWDQTKVTRSAVYCSNVSNLVMEENLWVGLGTFVTKPLFYVTVTNGAAMRSNWWRVYSNRIEGGQLVVVDNDYGKPFNGWVLHANRVDGQSGATAPFVYVGGADGQSRGWSVRNNTFRNVTTADAAVHVASPANGWYWYGNRGRDLSNTDNLVLKADDIASAYIEQSLGDVPADGNFEGNGQLYNATTPDTGSDGRGGRDIYDATKDVRLVVMGRY